MAEWGRVDFLQEQFREVHYWNNVTDEDMGQIPMAKLVSGGVQVSM